MEHDRHMRRYCHEMRNKNELVIFCCMIFDCNMNINYHQKTKLKIRKEKNKGKIKVKGLNIYYLEIGYSYIVTRYSHYRKLN